MGLLGDSWEDPRTAAILNLAGGLLSQRNLGAGLVQGMQGYTSAMLAAKKAQQDEEERKQKMALVAAQVAETQAQAEQRRAAAQEAARKQAEAEAMRKLLVGQLTPTQGIEANAVSGITGPRAEALAAVGAPRKIDAQALVAQGVPVETVKALMESPNYGRVEVSRTVQGKDAQGRPVTFQFDKFGQQVGQPIQDWKDQQTVDFGGQIYLRDPITNQLSKLGDKTQTPDSVASNAVARRGQDMTAQTAANRLSFDRESSGGYEYKNDSDGNLIAVPKKPTAAGPIQPIPVAAPNKNVRAANDALAIVEQARSLIPQATGSYAGMGVDQLARVVGSPTQGDKATAQLKVLESALMMKQPRMEGPQSDKDVMLYRQAAGQIGDPSVPAEIKLSALDAIEQLHKRYAGGNQKTSATMPTRPAPTMRYNPVTKTLEMVGD